MLSYYIKLGWRHIWQMPLLSSLIILAFALGIGVSMTMISYYQAMAKNPAPGGGSNLYAVQLAAYGDDMESWGGTADGLPRQVTYMDAENLRKAELPFASTPIYQFMPIMKSQRPGVGPSGDFRGRFVQRDFFSMFGLQFLHGGPWGKAIDLEPERQIVISRALNEWVFGGGNNVDKTLQIGEDPSPFTVVGIVDNWHPQPAYYDLTTGSFPRKGPEVFLPYALNPVLEEFPMGNISGWQNAILQSYQDLLKSEFVWQVFWVQLNNDDEVARYRAYLKAYVQQQRQLGRFANPNPRGELRNVSEWLDYNQVISRDNQVMVGLSFLFLLVCLVNTIGLLLAKFLRKMNEVGVRRALGASRRQIFSQYLVEVLLMGALGGLLGLLFTYLGLGLVRTLYKTQIAQLDLSLVAMTLLLSLIAACGAGLLPALRAANSNPAVFLKAQ